MRIEYSREPRAEQRNRVCSSETVMSAGIRGAVEGLLTLRRRRRR